MSIIKLKFHVDFNLEMSRIKLKHHIDFNLDASVFLCQHADAPGILPSVQRMTRMRSAITLVSLFVVQASIQTIQRLQYPCICPFPMLKPILKCNFTKFSTQAIGFSAGPWSGCYPSQLISTVRIEIKVDIIFQLYSRHFEFNLDILTLKSTCRL